MSTAPARSAARRARTLGWLTSIGGLVQLLTLLPFVHRRLGVFDQLGSLGFRVAGHVTSLLAGLALIYLGYELAKRKHTAWLLATMLFAISAVAHVVKGPHPVAAVFAAVMTALLIVSRRDFSAPGDPPTLFALIRFVPTYLALVIVYGFAALWIERDRIEPSFTVARTLETIVLGMVGADGAYTYESRFFDDFFPLSLLALGIVGLVTIVVLGFRPFIGRTAHGGDDWELAERIVREHGWDTLAYFALRDDKSFFFGSDGRAMIAYAYLGGYGLASADPIGDPASVPRVLDEYLAFCEERAWKPAFLAVREADRELYEQRGLRHFYLGDEAIIHCDTFTLDGKKMKGVRQAANRVARAYRFEVVPENEASPELVESLNAISRRWRGKAPERGFTMALSQDVKGEDPEFLLLVALDGEDRPGGFLRVVPAYGVDGHVPGYTLDLMRHDPDAPNGMTEFLIGNGALALKERGIVRLSMNFAAWGRLFHADLDYTRAQRLERRLVDLLHPFFQIKSLYDFNQKFFPEWLPRLLVYRDPSDLPRVGMLYVGAEGFLAVPGLGQQLVPHQVGGVPSPATVTG